jgi:hypothetical protein
MAGDVVVLANYRMKLTRRGHGACSRTGRPLVLGQLERDVPRPAAYAGL